MKSVRTILMGIAVILVGIAFATAKISDTFAFVGWGISIFGAIISFVGYFFVDEE